MTTQLLLKKKKKKLYPYEEQDIIDNNEQYYPLDTIKKKMLKFFSIHIGEASSASLQEIFEYVYGVNPEIVEPYKKFFMLSLLQRLIRALRSKNEAFIIKKADKYFVLKNEDECDYYKSVCKRAVKGMKESMKRAESWVEKEEWKKLIKD